MTSQIELSAGTIDCEDTAGDGPAIVLLPGLVMDASLRDEVTAHLSRGHLCVAPTLPLGAHRDAMRAGADLSSAGLARLVSELLDRLDLHDVTEGWSTCPTATRSSPSISPPGSLNAIRQLTHEPCGGAPQ